MKVYCGDISNLILLKPGFTEHDWTYSESNGENKFCTISCEHENACKNILFGCYGDHTNCLLEGNSMKESISNSTVDCQASSCSFHCENSGCSVWAFSTFCFLLYSRAHASHIVQGGLHGKCTNEPENCLYHSRGSTQSAKEAYTRDPPLPSPDETISLWVMIVCSSTVGVVIVGMIILFSTLCCIEASDELYVTVWRAIIAGVRFPFFKYSLCILFGVYRIKYAQHAGPTENSQWKKSGSVDLEAPRVLLHNLQPVPVYNLCISV